MSSVRFDIITIFPKVVEAYFNESILKRAREKKIIDVKIHDLRKFAKDKHKKGLPARMPARNAAHSVAGGRSFGRVDDRPFGGGPGMVLKLEPLVRAISKLQITNYKKTLIVLLSASGKQFNSEMAARFVKKYNHIVFICGHYEGVDERIKRVIRDSGFMIHELSIGPYVLTGGELPAMVVIDAVSRHILGVLGKAESIEEKRYGVGVPTYTRPEVLRHQGQKYHVPKVLLTGDHAKIAAWRKKHAKKGI